MFFLAQDSVAAAETAEDVAVETAKTVQEAAEGAVTANEATAGAAAQGGVTPSGTPVIDWTDPDQVWNYAYTLIGEYGLKVAGVLLIFLIAWVVSGIIGKVVGASMRRAKVEETLVRFFERLVGWTVLLLTGIACLSIFGIETTSFAATIAAAGLAIGLAFQGTLSNFAAGVMLLIFRPFKVGDLVELSGQLGVVAEIELFSTFIDTLDNRRVILPNSSVFGAQIENLTFHPERRVDVPVGVSYDSDIDKTREVLESAIEAVSPKLEGREDMVVLLNLGGSSVDWDVRVWAKTVDYWPTKQALVREVKMKLDEAGLSIPFPQMDVHIDGELVKS